MAKDNGQEENGTMTIPIQEGRGNRTIKVREKGKETQRRGNLRSDSGKKIRHSVPQPNLHSILHRCSKRLHRCRK